MLCFLDLQGVLAYCSRNGIERIPIEYENAKFVVGSITELLERKMSVGTAVLLAFSPKQGKWCRFLPQDYMVNSANGSLPESFVKLADAQKFEALRQTKLEVAAADALVVKLNSFDSKMTFPQQGEQEFGYFPQWERWKTEVRILVPNEPMDDVLMVLSYLNIDDIFDSVRREKGYLIIPSFAVKQAILLLKT
jgi:hypothetical protein